MNEKKTALYNVYQGDPNSISGGAPIWGLYEDEVIVLAKLFLNNGGNTIIAGERHYIRGEKFKVYKVDPSVGDSPDDIKKYYKSRSSLIYRNRILEDLFTHEATEVTREILAKAQEQSNKSILESKIFNPGKIFISHSSLDHELVKKFVDHILILGLHIPKEKIFCTSIEGMDIKSGTDFKNKILQELTAANSVIQIITENYKKSEVCLNEMGAAWVLSGTVVPFIIEPVNFSNIGFIHNTDQILRINKKEDLIKFKDDHHHTFGIQDFHSGIYERQTSEFLNYLSTRSHKSNIKNQNLTEKAQNFFSRFLIEDIDINSIIIKSQPTLADCKSVFESAYYKKIYELYNHEYLSLSDKKHNYQNLQAKSKINLDYFNLDDILNNQIDLQGGIKELANSLVLRPGITYVKVSFTEENKKDGYSLSVWCYINNRWVFFPKIWRIAPLISKLSS